MKNSPVRSLRPGLLPCLLLTALLVAWSGLRTFAPDDGSGHDLVSLFEVTPETEQSLQTGPDADGSALLTRSAVAATPAWTRPPAPCDPHGPHLYRPLRHVLCVYRL